MDNVVSDERHAAASSSVVKSAERALRVLEVLAGYARPVPTMAIARDCGIPKSSMHHLLNVMHARNFVTYYEAERAWGLGVAVFEVGSAYLRTGPLQRLGRPRLVALTQRARETSHLAVLHGSDVLYIDKEQPSGNAPKLVTEVGVRLPAHLTAVGLAILAHLTGHQLRALYANQWFVNRTGVGPRDLRELVGVLRNVREAGYAVDPQMTTRGICCVAAPVFSHEGLPMAAIGITFVAEPHGPDSRAELAALVRHESVRLSHALGWQPPVEDARADAAEAPRHAA